MARERTPCKTHPCSPPMTGSWEIPSCVMKVDGLDIGGGVEGVLVEEECTTCVMGHVEAISEKLVVGVVRRFLQGNDMPPSCNFSRHPSSFHRRGPGSQLWILLLCTIERVAKRLLELFM